MKGSEDARAGQADTVPAHCCTVVAAVTVRRVAALNSHVQSVGASALEAKRIKSWWHTRPVILDCYRDPVLVRVW